MSPLKPAFSVRPGGARTVAWGRAAVVTVTASMLLAGGCSDDDSTDVSGTPEATTSAAPTASATPTSSGTAASALAGTWRTGSVSIEDMVATIRRHGLDEHVEDFRANAPFSEDTVLVLSIENGDWNLYGESDDGQREPIDYDAEYRIDGDTVIFVHADGSNTYRWEVDGDTLRLEFLKSTLPGHEGIPDEVFQRALYMTADFTREN